jgi:hypothetical protein
MMARSGIIRRGPLLGQERGGRYYSWGGQLFRSVTTIIKGGLPAPAIVGWGMRGVAEAAIRHYAILGQHIDAGDSQGAIDWLKGAPYRDRDRRADLGKQVHAFAEAFVLEAPYPELPEDLQPYGRAFVSWLETFRPEFYCVEAPVLSRTEHHAGQLDAIIDVDHPGLAMLFGVAGRPVRLLIDYKTGASGVYPESALQLAAYRHSEFIGLPDYTEEPMPEVDGAAVLWLQPDRFELLPVQADEAIYTAFRYVREVYRFQLEQAEHVIGLPVRPPKVAVA